MTALQAAQIVVTRTLNDDGEDIVSVEASEMTLVEALGLLRMAEDTVIQHPEILTYEERPMTADEPVAGVPRMCARRADCTRPRGHDDECGPDRADTELADLRAEVERLRDVTSSERVASEDYIADLRAERDDALARLAEAEGVARTNAAWVKQQHAAAKEAREQVKAVRAMADEWEREYGRESEAHRVFGPQVLTIPFAVETIRAALDAVEPADQPHPTPEVYTASPGWTKATGLTGGDARVEVVLGPRPRSEGEAGEPADQPHPTPEADDEVEAFITEATRPPRQHGARS